MIKRLGDICTFVGGGTPSKKNPDFFNGSIPWATVRDMNVRVIKTTEHSITPDAVQQSATNIIPQGEVVISTHVGLGKVCVLGQDTAINQDLKAVIPNWGLSRRYLYYWFISKADELIANGKGATVKGVALDFVKNLKIQVLSEREQEVVSDTLDKVNHIIELADAQVSRLDQLVKSRFVEMFEDYEASVKKVALGDICDLVTVGIANSATHAYADKGVVMFRNQNIHENKLDETDLIHIKESFAAKYEAKTLRENDLLVTRTGYPGVACLVPSKYEGAQTFTTLIARLADLKKSNPVFVCHYINSAYGKRFVDKNKVGIAQQNFGAKALAELPIFLPPLALQREFAAFVAKVDKLAFAARQRRDVAKQLYKAKIQEFFG